MAQESSCAPSTKNLDQEQRQALLMIASGAPMEHCLDALTDAVGRLLPGTRACVLLANEDRSAMSEGYSSHFPPTFANSIRGLPIGEALIGTCGAAIFQGHPVGCPDVEHSTEWSPQWRSLCLSNDIRACYSHPALGAGGKAVGSFFLCLSEAREPNAWERKVAEFGALATSIVVERERAAAQMRKEMLALARLQEVSVQLVGPGEPHLLFQKILAAAADISGTDKGNIQVFDPVKRNLRILVHQGLGERFVDHFSEDGWDPSCGEAASKVEQLVLPDVAKLEHLHGTTGLEVVLEEQIRSIQCTPLVSRDGRLLGMLNNHYPWPGGPSPTALRYIDLLARQAAELLERHQIETVLESERSHKDQFLAMLAHELRNPLAPLQNMLEVQKRAEDDKALCRRARDVMERQVHQLIRLVDDLLDVSRISRGKLELRLESLSIQKVVQDALEVCLPAIEQHGHQLKVTLPDDPIIVLGDAARLTQVFGNVLANACKYTPKGGDIALGIEVTQTEARVLVKDNGSGIPHDEIGKIFDMFTQVDSSLERSQGGLGIGLMLVKKIVEMHGGKVQAHSEGLGQGSEFLITLPIAQPYSVLSRDTPSAPSVKPRSIVVVDDNKDAAQSLQTLLTLEGHETRTAFGGIEALAICEDRPPDVILMDIGMPGMSGYEVCRHIRAREWGQQVTVIALSGWSQDQNRQICERGGFDAHLVKPVQLETLNRLLSNLLD